MPPHHVSVLQTLYISFTHNYSNTRNPTTSKLQHTFSPNNYAKMFYFNRLPVFGMQYHQFIYHCPVLPSRLASIYFFMYPLFYKLSISLSMYFSFCMTLHKYTKIPKPLLISKYVCCNTYGWVGMLIWKCIIEA